MTSVPGRSGKADKDWLKARGTAFTSRVKIATLDPFHGYKNAIDDQLEDAVAVLDAFLPRKREVPPVVKLGAKAVDDMRRRIQTDIHGHRGRKGDPLYRIRTTLHAGEENLTDRQRERLTSVWESDEHHVAVEVAWACSQQLRSAYHQHTPAAGRIIAQQIINTVHMSPPHPPRRLANRHPEQPSVVHPAARPRPPTSPETRRPSTLQRTKTKHTQNRSRIARPASPPLQLDGNSRLVSGSE